MRTQTVPRRSKSPGASRSHARRRDMVAGLGSILLALVLALAAQDAAAAEAPPQSGLRLGLSFGTPAGANLEFLAGLGTRALYLSGGYWGSTIYGVQGGALLERYGSARASVAIGFVVGHFRFREEDSSTADHWTYAGVEAYFRFHDFFLAPALTEGQGTLPGPVLMGRLGLTRPI